MKLYKNRALTKGERVKVYVNLRTGGFSLVALKGRHAGRVVAHADRLELVNCEFKVMRSGRERVVKERQKNVHAYVYGTFAGTNPHKGKRIRYNPYLYETFVDEKEKPVTHSEKIGMIDQVAYFN